MIVALSPDRMPVRLSFVSPPSQSKHSQRCVASVRTPRAVDQYALAGSVEAADIAMPLWAMMMPDSPRSESWLTHVPLRDAGLGAVGGENTNDRQLQSPQHADAQSLADAFEGSATVLYTQVEQVRVEPGASSTAARGHRWSKKNRGSADARVLDTAQRASERGMAGQFDDVRSRGGSVEGEQTKNVEVDAC